jgi:membrane protein
MSIKNILDLFKATFSDWKEDKASRLAAALSYYTIFSLAPLLTICIAIAGSVFGRDAARGLVKDQVERLMGAQSADAIQSMLIDASKPSKGIVASAIGVLTLLLGASGVFGQLKDGLDTIWEIEPKPGRGIVALVRDRFLSLAMVVGIGFLLLVSLIISASLAALGKIADGSLPLKPFVLEILNSIVAFIIATVLFALIYKVLPDVEIRWSDVWIGAVITSVLFTIGKILIGLYLGRSGVASVYGAAGSLLLILIWVYYSAQIVFFGAEFTQVYANRYGSQIKPREGAAFISDEARAQQGLRSKN